MLSSPQDGNTYFQAGMYNDAAAKYKKVSRVKRTCDGGGGGGSCGDVM